MTNNGLVNTAAQAESAAEQRHYGVYVAQVISNTDLRGRGRVKIHLPWLPEIEPTARVAVPLAGSNRGLFFIPQQDDEVLVAFNQGDIRDPIVIGSLWNSQDLPPATAPVDAQNKFIIRTPAGHEILFDDQGQSIQVTSSSDHKIHLGQSEIKVEMSGSEAKVTLNSEGDLTIEANRTLSLKGQDITLEAQNKVDLKANTSLSINGGQNCTMKATMVNIN